MGDYAETSSSQIAWAALSFSSYRSLCVVQILKKLLLMPRHGSLRIIIGAAYRKNQPSGVISVLEGLRFYSHVAPPFQFCTRRPHNSLFVFSASPDRTSYLPD